MEVLHDLFKSILWTDEAVFPIDGFVNHHNCHYWAGEDPFVISKQNAELTQSNGVVWVDSGQDYGSIHSS